MKINNTGDLLTAFQTRKSLLLRLKDQNDQESWREFYDIYGRLIFGYALRFDLSHSEAEDVVQEVCVKMFRNILSFNYTPEKGHFRGWLKAVTKNAVIDFLRRKERRSAQMGEYKILAEDVKKHQEDELWKLEWEKAVMNVALQRVYDRVGDKSQHVFHYFVIENISANEVSRRLDIDPNAVYACKHRMLRMIREEVETLKEDI